MSAEWSLEDARKAVDHLFMRPRGSIKGPLTRLDDGRVLLPGVLFQFGMKSTESDERVLMQLFRGLGTLGVELWEQEARALLRLSSAKHPALPEVIEGGHDADTELAFVVTKTAKYAMDTEGTMGYLLNSPLEAIRQTLLLTDALVQLHGRGMMHRNLWPGALEVVVGPEPGVGGIALRLARFEMSTIISNILRRVDARQRSQVSEVQALYRSQGPSALVCCPPERLSFLYPGPKEDMLEDSRSDVYSLGIIAYQWFIEPLQDATLSAIFTKDGCDRAALSELHRKMMQNARSSEKIHRKLADVLRSMLEPDRRSRPTSAQVVAELASSYEDIIAKWREADEQKHLSDGKNPVYLVSVAVEEFKSTLFQWEWIHGDPASSEGWQEAKAFIEEDLKDGRILHSPSGYIPYRTSGRGKESDLRKAKYVLVGRQAAYFASYHERERAPWKVVTSADQNVEQALHVRYVLRLDWSNARNIASQMLYTERLPGLEIVRLRSPELDTERLAHRRSWKPILMLVERGVAPPEWQQQFQQAIDWLLEVQRVQLEARVYAFTREQLHQRGFVDLRVDESTDQARIYNWSLLYLLTTVRERAAFGDFFDTLEDPAEVVIETRDPKRERELGDNTQRTRAFVRKRLDRGRIQIEVRPGSAPIPATGWIRPAEDIGTRRMLARQESAKAELFENQGLIEQLHMPRALLRARSQWVGAGDGLLGAGREIVEDMLNCWPFYALHGPPGTGKTTVTSKAITKVLEEDRSHRILVSAQSHYSLDNMAMRIVDNLGLGGARHEATAKEKSHGASLLAVRISSSESEGKVHPRILELLPRKLAEEQVKSIKDHCTKELAGLGANDPKRRILEEWTSHVEGSVLELMDRLRRGANLVFATCGMATQQNLASTGDEGLFDWVIVEEAAKAWPTELAIPLVRGVKWTLIGDHKQLPAFGLEDIKRLLKACAESEDERLKEYGTANQDAFIRTFQLFGSLFPEAKTTQTDANNESKDNSHKRIERAKGREPPAIKQGLLKRPCGRLDTQFRMREPIAELVSRVFYESALITDCSTNRDNDLSAPDALVGQCLVWVDTSRLVVSHEEPRWKNPGEAMIVAKLIRKLHPSPLSGYRLASEASEKIAILSPYWDQVRQLHAKLPEYASLIQTIDSFQGKEADIVVISLVRDNSRQDDDSIARLGHLDDRARVNVMLSRGRRLLVLVGNYRHFNETKKTVWQDVCKNFIKLGMVIDAELVLGASSIAATEAALR